MGLLVDGQWQDKWYDTSSSGGKFQRESAKLRNWVTADGNAGPSGVGGFKAESGRYQFVCVTGLPMGASHACFSQVEESGAAHRCVGGQP